MSSLARLSGTGLLLSVLVTGLLYWAVGLSVATGVRRTGAGQRKGGPTLSRRISRILSYVSSNSLDDLIDTIKPAMKKLDMLPDISRVGTGNVEDILDDKIVDKNVAGALESVGSVTNMVSDSVTGGIQTVSDGVSGSLQTVSDTADTLSRVVSDKKLKDCLMQAVCYLTPEDVTEEEGEGRKNKDKQDRREKEKKEKQERKKNKKKKKKKQEKAKDDIDSEIATDVPDENESDNDTTEINSDDCEVFECDIVGYGYTAYKVFDKLRQVKERIENLDKA